MGFIPDPVIQASGGKDFEDGSTPRKTITEMYTGLYILPDFNFWAVFGRRGCLNKSAKY